MAVGAQSNHHNLEILDTHYQHTIYRLKYRNKAAQSPRQLDTGLRHLLLLEMVACHTTMPPTPKTTQRDPPCCDSSYITMKMLHILYNHSHQSSFCRLPHHPDRPALPNDPPPCTDDPFPLHRSTDAAVFHLPGRPVPSQPEHMATLTFWTYNKMSTNKGDARKLHGTGINFTHQRRLGTEDETKWLCMGDHHQSNRVVERHRDCTRTCQQPVLWTSGGIWHTGRTHLHTVVHRTVRYPTVCWHTTPMLL